jgi:hypothetical protein
MDKAARFRWVTGTSGLDKVLRKALKVLFEWGIPHLVGGGYAVQAYEYRRTTDDVDIIVPDIARAVDVLSRFDFKEISPTRVADRKPPNLEIDLLQGGKRMGVSPVPFPQPTQVSSQPQIAPLPDLVSLKLGAGRSQDIADVVHLITANSLPKNYAVDPAVKAKYEQAWDTAAAETAAQGLLGEE